MLDYTINCSKEKNKRGLIALFHVLYYSKNVSHFFSKNFLSSTTLIGPLLLAPFTVLILLSQNTVPGNLLYPYKRGLEYMILAAVSINPTTKAYFHADLSDRRYTEAEALLLAKKDVSGLTSFVDEVHTTELAINNVSDPVQKQQMQQNLIAKIDDYQNRLTSVQTQFATNEAASNQQGALPVGQNPTLTPTIQVPTPTATRKRNG